MPREGGARRSSWPQRSDLAARPSSRIPEYAGPTVPLTANPGASQYRPGGRSYFVAPLEPASQRQRALSFRFAWDQLDVVPVERHRCLTAIEQDPNTPVKSAAADDGAFLFGEPWVARSSQSAHLESRPFGNGRSGHAIATSKRINENVGLFH
jgi:hypothetical protein